MSDTDQSTGSGSLRRTTRLASALREEKPDSILRTLIVLLMNVPTVLQLGWQQPVVDHVALHTVQYLLLVIYAFPFAARLLGSKATDSTRLRTISRTQPEFVVMSVGIVLGWLEPILIAASMLLLIVHLVRLFVRLIEKTRTPGLTFILAFLVLIFCGAGALMLPAATPAEHPITPLDALFTSTSAVCVTGLIVRDTAVEFTRFGHVVILTLIQLGGLGIVLFAALITVFRSALHSVRASRAVLEVAPHVGRRPVDMQRIVAMSLVGIISIELIGAMLLYVGWPETWHGAPVEFASPADRAFHCLFFAVSAFCNAGFATTPNSLQGLREHWTTLAVVPSLIVLGGLGLPVLFNLADVTIQRLRGKRIIDGTIIRLTLHTRIVLIMTIVLYGFGLFTIFAGSITQRGTPLFDGLIDAHFASITARTAGFDTVPPLELGPLARFVLILLMFVGGSPGSTAGGVKTVAFAVVLLAVWSTIRGRPHTSAFRREIPEGAIHQAMALIVLGLATVLGVVTVLTLNTELRLEATGTREPFESILFESVSAVSTVGLSMGITAQLDATGRFILIVAMFLGRVGPLAAVAALAGVAARREVYVRYAREDVMMS